MGQLERLKKNKEYANKSYESWMGAVIDPHADTWFAPLNINIDQYYFIFFPALKVSWCNINILTAKLAQLWWKLKKCLGNTVCVRIMSSIWNNGGRRGLNVYCSLPAGDDGDALV